MVNKTFNIDVDIKQSLTNRPFEVVQGDTGNIINISVLDDGQPVDLTGCRVLAIFSKSSGTSSQDSGVADGGITISGNTVQLQLFTSSFDLGMIECELQIYSDSGMSTLITTAKFNFKARRGILNDNTVQSANEYPVLVQLIRQVEDMSHDIPWLPSAEAGNAVFVGTEGRLESRSGEATREALGAANMIHSSQHAADGEDPVTPESIGAADSPESLAALPDSGTALAKNAEYRIAEAVGTYAFEWPASPFECWLRFDTAATFSLTFPAGTTYIGGAPTFAASKTYEMSVKDGVVVVQEVATA